MGGLHLEPANQRASEEFLDRLFGSGMGKRHRAHVARAASGDKFLASMDLYHLMTADTRVLSLELHYLLGVCVFFAMGINGTGMGFAKILLNLGVSPDKIREAVSRLHVWAGRFAASESLAYLERAIADFEERGLASLPWFAPEEP